MTLQNMPLRGEDIRKKNEKIVLCAIQKSDGLSQSDIVNLTGLKAPTVLRIFTILEKRGLIKIAKDYAIKDLDKRGRKPVYYRVIPTAHYVIGVEFWSRTAHVLIVDFSKQPVYSEDLTFPEGSDADTIVALIGDLVVRALEKTGIEKEKILGMGIGAPGRINVDTGEIIYYARIIGFTNYPLGSRLQERFKMHVSVNNNAGVIAMNAYRRGVAKNSDALFTYFIRQGVGGAFITNGRLVSVLGKTVFEVGHTTAVVDGRPCYCGAKGCLETYISETAILEAACRNGYDFTEIEQVAQKLRNGDETLERLIRKEAVQLVMSAQNIFRTLSPDGFLIITRSKEISELYAKIIQECLVHDSYNAKDAKVVVYADTYSPIEAGFGACDLIFDRFFYSTRDTSSGGLRYSM